MRLVDQRRHLIAIKRLIFGTVAGPGAGATGGGAFDHIRARPHHGAHDIAHLLHTIGHAGGHIGTWRHATDMARGADAVADAANRRDNAQG